MNNFEGTLELKSPLTKECWDKLADVELENTERIWFTTPSEKRVEYMKASVLDKIRAEIEKQKECRCFDDDDMYIYKTGLNDAIDIIDKYKAESEKQ